MAFHPYPQVIQCFFNNNRFGPPREVNHASPCSWIDHLVSGLLQRTNSPYSDSLSLRLRLNTLTKPVTSNSQVHSSIGTRLALLTHGPFTVCRHAVSCSISLPFRGSFHLSLTVLVRYRFPQNIWPWRMVPPASDRVSRAPPYSRTTPQDRLISSTGLSPSMVRLSSRLLLTIDFVTRVQRFGSETAVVQPRSCNARMLAHKRFRLFPVRSPLLGESRLMSVPPAT